MASIFSSTAARSVANVALLVVLLLGSEVCFRKLGSPNLPDQLLEVFTPAASAKVRLAASSAGRDALRREPPEGGASPASHARRQREARGKHRARWCGALVKRRGWRGGHTCSPVLMARQLDPSLEVQRGVDPSLLVSSNGDRRLQPKDLGLDRGRVVRRPQRIGREIGRLASMAYGSTSSTSPARLRPSGDPRGKASRARSRHRLR